MTTKPEGRISTSELAKLLAKDREARMLSPEEIERLKRNAKETAAYLRAELAKRPRIDLDNLPPEDIDK